MDKKAHQKATLVGFRWSFIDQILAQGTTFIVGIILMNLLPPSEFGLIAMATVFTGFLAQFSKFGLTASLVQSPNLTKIDINTVFWFSLVMGGILAALLFFSSWPISKLYGQPELIPIIQVLAAVFLLVPLSSVPSSLLQRELDFSKLFVINATSIIISSGITIYLAFQGLGVWALVFQKVCENILRVIMASLFVQFRPRFIFSLIHLKKHMKFGLPYLGSKSIIYWIGNADNLLIGYFMNPNALGFYSRSYALATIPSNQIGATLFKVLFPSLSKLQNDKESMRINFHKMNKILMFVITPIMLFLMLGAEPFIVLIAGEEWIASAPLLKFLALVAITKVNMLLFHNLLLSQGRTDLDFKLQAYLSPVLIASFIVGVMISLQTLVVIYSIVSFLILLVWYFVISKFLEMSFLDFTAVLLNVLLSLFFIYVGWNILYPWIINCSNITILILCFFYVSLSWITIQLLFKKKETLQHIELFKQLIGMT